MLYIIELIFYTSSYNPLHCVITKITSLIIYEVYCLWLYKNKKIAVVSTLKEFEHEVEFLASLASEVVFIPLYKDDSINIDNVVKIKKMPIEILDSDNKKSLIFKDDEVLVDGVFMLKASISPSALVFGIEAVDGHIVVDRNGKTNLRGCFACGDCTGRPYQYAKAVGEGNVCAHSAVAYLNNVG